MAAPIARVRKTSSPSGHTRIKLPNIPLDMPGRYTTGNILAVTGWSHSTLYNRIKAGQFPAPRKDHGSNMNHWDTDVVREALGL